MAEQELEISEDMNLNIEGKRNVPLCPMCAEELASAQAGYSYKRINPDTRWFWCEECGCHLGFQRMKKKWKVDPHDLDSNDKIREYFGLGPVGEEIEEVE